jgi:hypothetical protein
MWKSLESTVEQRSRYLVERIITLEGKTSDEIVTEYQRLRGAVIENNFLQSTMQEIREAARGGKRGDELNAD